VLASFIPDRIAAGGDGGEALLPTSFPWPTNDHRQDQEHDLADEPALLRVHPPRPARRRGTPV